MTDYFYNNDGKIHTRFSDLLRCTSASVQRLLDEREKKVPRYSSTNMDFGTDRHDMWEKEAKQTGKLPEIFGLNWKADHIEKEFASELLPGIVVHSRPDVVCLEQEAVVDYKTLCADSYEAGCKSARSKYHSARQLRFYAFQLGLHNIKIRKAVYLIEIWNKEQTEILGHFSLERPLDLKTISAVLPWARERMLCLARAIAEREAL